MTILRVYLTGLMAIVKRTDTKKTEAVLISTRDEPAHLQHRPLLFWRDERGMWQDPHPLNRVRLSFSEPRGQGPLEDVRGTNGFATCPRNPLEALDLHWLPKTADLGVDQKVRRDVLRQEEPSRDVIAQVDLGGGCLSVHHLIDYDGQVAEIDFGHFRRSAPVVLVVERELSDEETAAFKVTSKPLDGGAVESWPIPSYKLGLQQFIDVLVSNTAVAGHNSDTAHHFQMYSRLFNGHVNFPTPKVVLGQGAPMVRQPHGGGVTNLPDEILNPGNGHNHSNGPTPAHTGPPGPIGDPGNRPICPIVEGKGP
ncbi:MAG TPA: hypothetical protein VHQ65_08225 [Thermoanaerobaculia bacterium]|nr:hypothetical protein [Thermoanaerobaculia bacterium]